MNKKVIDKILQDYQRGHSNVQIKYFNVKKEGDNWAQYKQCLYEIDSRKKSFEDLKEICNHI